MKKQENTKNIKNDNKKYHEKEDAVYLLFLLHRDVIICALGLSLAPVSIGD